MGLWEGGEFWKLGSAERGRMVNDGDIVGESAVRWLAWRWSYGVYSG